MSTLKAISVTRQEKKKKHHLDKRGRKSFSSFREFVFHSFLGSRIHLCYQKRKKKKETTNTSCLEFFPPPFFLGPACEREKKFLSSLIGLGREEGKKVLQQKGYSLGIMCLHSLFSPFLHKFGWVQLFPIHLTKIFESLFGSSVPSE